MSECGCWKCWEWLEIPLAINWLELMRLDEIKAREYGWKGMKEILNFLISYVLEEMN